jgi:hypothetical protein
VEKRRFIAVRADTRDSERRGMARLIQPSILTRSAAGLVADWDLDEGALDPAPVMVALAVVVVVLATVPWTHILKYSSSLCSPLARSSIFSLS